MQHIIQKTKKYSQQQTARSVPPFTCHSRIKQKHSNGQNVHSFGIVMLNGNATDHHKKGLIITTTTITTTTTNSCTFLLSGSPFSLKN
jgi:hypothetical protein